MDVEAVSGQSPQIIEHYARRHDKTKLGDATILSAGAKQEPENRSAKVKTFETGINRMFKRNRESRRGMEPTS